MLLGIGKRVKTFVDDKVVTGEVKDVTANAVIIESGDEVFKVSMSDVEEIDETIDEEIEPVAESKDTITITRDDFTHAVMRAITPDKFECDGKIDDPMFLMTMSMSGIIIGKNIEKELFGDND